MSFNFLARSQKHSLLCQVDGQICRTFGFSNPDLKSFVALISEEEYDDLKNTISSVESTHNLLMKAYHQMKVENCVIRPDFFDGHGLFYQGKKTLEKRQRISILGYLEKIPKKDEPDFSNLSVMAPREGSKLSRVMVGPARFVNHSCRPNCDYQAVEINGKKAVQIVTRQQILTGTELLCFYGTDFFGPGNRDCKCPNESFHVSVSTPATNAPEASVELSPIAGNSNVTETQVIFRMRNFKRQYRHPNLPVTPKKTCWIDLRLPDGEISDHSCSESDHSSEESTQTSTAALENEFSSSPATTVNQAPESRRLAESKAPNSPENEKFDIMDFEPIKNSTKISVDNFIFCVESLATLHGTSNKEAGSWLRLCRLTHPNTSIPSFKTLKKRNVLEARRRVVKSEASKEGEWCVLNFVEEIENLLKRNIDVIVKYNENKDASRDLKLPNTIEKGSGKLNIFLILNADGVKVIQCRHNSLWPVWIAIANLPPILRSAFKNIILAGLWFGTDKPPWTSFLKAISEQLKPTTFKLAGTQYTVVLKPVFLVADTPARYSLLNWTSFNGYYGCCYCYNEGKRYGKIHFYPNIETKMRTTKEYEDNVKFVRKHPSLKNWEGVKGFSAASFFCQICPYPCLSTICIRLHLGLREQFSI